MTFLKTRLTHLQRLASGGNAEDWQGFFIMPCARRSYEAKRHIFDRNLPGSLSWTGRGAQFISYGLDWDAPAFAAGAATTPEPLEVSVDDGRSARPKPHGGKP